MVVEELLKKTLELSKSLGFGNSPSVDIEESCGEFITLYFDNGYYSAGDTLEEALLNAIEELGELRKEVAKC